MRLHSFVRRISAPPTNVCKTRSSCSDLLSLLAVLAVTVRSTSSRSTMSGSDSFMEHCGCAPVPRRTSGAVAQPQCSQSCAMAEPVQPEHVYSMVMHG